MDARIVKTALEDMPGCFQIHAPPTGVYADSAWVSANGKLAGITGGTMEDGSGVWNASAATLQALVHDREKTQSGEKQRVFIFDTRASQEHRQAVLERFQAAYPDTPMNASSRGVWRLTI